MPRSRSLIGPAALILGCVAAACGRPSSDDPTKEIQAVQKREKARVLVAPVVQREMLRMLETTTRAESESHVSIYPRAQGIVTELLVEEGDRVPSGAVLARLDDRDARIAEQDAAAALSDARATLPKLQIAIHEGESRMRGLQLAYEQAERDHERNVRIAEGSAGEIGLISKKDLDASQLARDQRLAEFKTAEFAWRRAEADADAGRAALERSQLALDRARLNLSFMTITAPVAGVIAERALKVGDTLTSASLVFVITDPDRLRAVFYRPQRELGFFQAAISAAQAWSAGPSAPAPMPSNGGSHASPDGSAPAGPSPLELTATAEALPGWTFRGTIERIAPTIDAASGNFRVTARMEALGKDADGRAGPRLLPGMLLRLEMVTERRPEALCVPKRAIRREGDRRLVFVVEEGVARRVEVEEGLTDDQDVQVKAVTAEGAARLAPGAQVVVVGNRDLEDGAEVSLPEPAAEAAGPGGDSDPDQEPPQESGGQ